MFLFTPWLLRRTAKIHVEEPNNVIRVSSLTPTHLLARLKQYVEFADFSRASIYYTVKWSNFLYDLRVTRPLTVVLKIELIGP